MRIQNQNLEVHFGYFVFATHNSRTTCSFFINLVKIRVVNFAGIFVGLSSGLLSMINLKVEWIIS